MCDMGGGGGGGFGGGFGGGGGGGIDLGFGGVGDLNLDLSGLGALPAIEPIEIDLPDPSEIIEDYANSRANAFADMYDEKRTTDALTKGYFANARKVGIAEDVNASLQSIFDNEASRKQTATDNYKKSLKNKYSGYTGIVAPDPTADPLDMTDINAGLVENVDDGTRTATLGGARRFVGRLAPKLFGGENLKPIDSFRTRRRFQKDDDGGTSGTRGFKNFSFNQRRAGD